MSSRVLTTGMQPAIDVRALSFSYRDAEGNDIPVLKDFHFLIEHLEWTALIGPSGCGKTTVAKLITGVELPDTGTVLTLGAPPRAVRETRQLGVAFQGHSLVPWFTVRRNIGLPMMGLTDHQDPHEPIRALAAAFKIEHRLTSLPVELSGGMTARVALARALIHKPKLVVLDEPFAALDEITAIQITRYLLRWRENNPCSLLLISHDLEAVARLTDRCFCFPARDGDDFESVDLRPYGRPVERSSETVARIRTRLLEKYL